MRLDGGYALIQFCPFCGRQFPASQRESLHCQPDGAELDEISNLTSIKGIEQLQLVLGEPDEIINGQNARQFRFGRWRTIELIVRVHNDNTLEFLAIPKSVKG
jgi:hypothetical protein